MKVAMISGVLTGLASTRSMSSKQLNLKKEVDSGYNLNAYFITMSIVSSIEYGLYLIFTGAIGKTKIINSHEYDTVFCHQCLEITLNIFCGILSILDKASNILFRFIPLEFLHAFFCNGLMGSPILCNSSNRKFDYHNWYFPYGFQSFDEWCDFTRPSKRFLLKLHHIR